MGAFSLIVVINLLNRCENVSQRLPRSLEVLISTITPLFCNYLKFFGNILQQLL